MRVDRSETRSQTSDVDESPPPSASPTAASTAASAKGADSAPGNSVEKELPAADLRRYGSRGVSLGSLPGGHARSAEDAVLEAKTALAGYWVSSGDVDRAIGALEGLAPDAYVRALRQLDGKPLSVLLDSATAEQKARLVAQAEAHGLLSRVEGRRAPDVPGHPPDGPALLKNDGSLPQGLRTAVQEQNAAAVRQYFADHHAYLKRYESLVESAKDPFELRALGKPVEYMRLWEPGVRTDTVQDKELAKAWREVRPEGPGRPTDAYERVSARTADFVGRQRPGTFSAKMDAEIEAKLGDSAVKSGGSIGVTQYGQMTSELTTGVSKNGVSLEVNDQHAKKVAVTVGIPKVGSASVDSEGTVKLEAGVGKFAKVGTEVNASKGTMAASVGVGADLGFVSADLSVSGTFQGANKGIVTAGVHAVGVFDDPMPELDARVPWKQIPEERQKQLYSYGIDQKQWEAELARRTKK